MIFNIYRLPVPIRFGCLKTCGFGFSIYGELTVEPIDKKPKTAISGSNNQLNEWLTDKNRLFHSRLFGLTLSVYSVNIWISGRFGQNENHNRW